MNTLISIAEPTETNDQFHHPSVSRFFPLRRDSFCRPRSWYRLVAVVLAAVVAFFLAVSPGGADTTGIPELDDALEAQKAGRLNQAVQQYTEVLEKHPHSAEALNWRGMAYDDLGEYDKALSDLTKAINISPNYADAYNNRGEVLRKLKKYREALVDFRKAVSLEPNFAEAHYNIGMILEQVDKKPAEAAKEYEQYLKLKPQARDKQDVLEKIKTLQAAAAAQPQTKTAEVKPTPAQPPVRHPAGQPPAGQATVQPPAGKGVVQPSAGRPAAPGAQPPKAPTSVQPPKKFQPGAPAPALKPQPPLAAPGLPGGIPTSPEQLQALTNMVLPLLMASLGFVVVGLLVYIVISSLPYFLIANKTGTPGAWMAFLPILDKYLKVRIAGKGMLMFILFVSGDPVVQIALLVGLAFLGTLVFAPILYAAVFLPVLLSVISTLVWIPICTGIADARGKASFWGLLICLPLILVCLLSFVVTILDPSLAKDLNPVFTALFGVSFLTWLFVPYYLAVSR